MSTDLSHDLFDRLADLHSLAPQMRIGQLLGTLGILAEDTGRSIWDLEDHELMEVVERLRKDLERRQRTEPE